jgi:hypothetical protein
LVLVSQRRPTAGRLPFLIVVGGVLVIGLVGVLLLHMVAAQDAYKANAMKQRLAALSDQEQQLDSIVEADSSPDALRNRAAAIGMRPASVTKFHKLRDGRALGVQTPVYLPPPVTQTLPSSTIRSDALNGNKDGKQAAKSNANAIRQHKTSADPNKTGNADTTANAPAHHHQPTGP